MNDQAHSKSQYKRLKAQGADVNPPPLTDEELNRKVAELEEWVCKLESDREGFSIREEWSQNSSVCFGSPPPYVTSGDLMVELMVKHRMDMEAMGEGEWMAMAMAGTYRGVIANTPQRAVALARLAMEE